MSLFSKRYEALSQRFNSVEDADPAPQTSRLALDHMSLRTLVPAAEQIVPLIRINGVKEDEMPFIFKRRRGRRRGLWWLSVMAGMVLFVLGLVLCGSELKDTEGPQQRLKPVIRDSWLGWTKMRYIFVLYVLRSERDS